MKRNTRETMRNEKKGFSRAIAASCAAVLTCSLALSGCGGKGETEGEETAEKDNSILVETTLPQTESIELTGDFMGTIEADSEVTVVAKIGGDVTAAYFEEGDRVNAGDLLFTIDDRSAQISMAQAQASLESASATVSSASAGASAAELNLLYTQEQIKETLGTTETSRMQLENAVASAKYALKAAQENWEFAKENFGISKDAYHDLENRLEHSGDHRKAYTKEAEALEAYAQNYMSLKQAGGKWSDNGLLVDEMNKLGLTPAILGLSGDPSAQDVADRYLSQYTEFSNIYTIGIAASSFRNAAAMEENAKAEADSSKNSEKLSLFQTAISLEQAEDNVAAAEDAKRLAEKMLEDFNLYTMATIWVGANADLAGTNSKLISAQAGVIQAQAGVKSAQAGVEAAQLQLEYTQVTAPVSGVITEKNVTVNNMAQQGSTAYVIAADGGNSVVFYVAESVMRELSIGQDVTVERNGSTYSAVITENAGVADADSGLFEIKAQLSDAAALIADTSVKITLATQKAENVMTIPVDSVYYENQKAFVYCMQDGVAVKTQIETGITNNETVEVVSGLTNDSQVITTWASQLKDGSLVKLKTDKAADKADEAAPSGDGVTEDADTEAVEAASIADVDVAGFGTELTDTARLNLSIEERIMQENEVQ